MDYLTKYYKNLCEQYQEQLDDLKRKIANDTFFDDRRKPFDLPPDIDPKGLS